VTNVEILEHMRNAAIHVGAVVSELDDSYIRCDHCGAKKFADIADRDRRQELEGALNRIQKRVEELESGNWPGRDLADEVVG
jgi:hypothetical protein